MNNKLDNYVTTPVGSTLGAITTGRSAHKKTITIKEIENGYVIHFDKNGFASGEKNFVAKSEVEIGGIINEILGLVGKGF